MIYAIIQRGRDAGKAACFDTWDAYHAATFSPYTNNAVFSIPAFIPGKTYAERKHAAENALPRASEIMQAPGLSWSELAEIQTEAERIARRYGLLREARENGIC